MSSILARSNELLNVGPFSLENKEHSVKFLEAMVELTNHHVENCMPYSQIISNLSHPMNWNLKSNNNVPFLPVRLFKELELRSIEIDQVFKVMFSSGTSGNLPSKIFLNRENAKNQSLALSRIFKDFINLSRPPILIIDAEKTIMNRGSFSARAAGILGFSFLGRDITFALNDDMSINLERVKNFIEQHQSESILLFGFTSIIWEHFVNSISLTEMKNQFQNATILHGGGWKKLEALKVGSIEFKHKIFESIGAPTVVNYYGLVEQTGSIYFECNEGFFHSSVYSNIVTRDPFDFVPLSYGEEGLLQLQSILPTSYPGHSLLTEDVGTILGVDDCKCGRLGQRFTIKGRIPDAEVRGCSDTYAS
jgi:hypothetical protein